MDADKCRTATAGEVGESGGLLLEYLDLVFGTECLRVE